MQQCGRCSALLALAVVLLLSPASAVQFFSYTGGTLLHRNDDEYSSSISIGGGGFPYFGRTQTSLFVCTNGIVSFGSGVNSYSPVPFPSSSNPVVAVFWGDIDTRSRGEIYYQAVTGSGLTEVNEAVRSAASAFSTFAATWAYVVTWINVPPYPGSSTDSNTFQLTLVTDGTASFVIFHYNTIQWTTGTASEIPAQMGFDAGDNTNYYAHEWSRTQSISSLPSSSNVRVNGRYIYSVGGAVVQPIDEAVNYCQNHACVNGATCNNGASGYTCRCPAGYSGQYCATNTNDCSPNPCQNSGACTDGVNSYTCSCAAGFSGTTCQTNVNECSPNPCQNGATCTDGVNSYTCSCAAGYSGSTCQTNVNECSPNPCQNGGTCTDGINSFTCRCAAGYSGSTCQTNINECSPNPCQNGAACTDGVNSYTCSCAPGYSGYNCETDFNECGSDPCQNGATCNDHVNRYTCICAPGYQGTNCESEINECLSGPCQHEGTCTDFVNGYTCDCVPGYTGTNCETNINECESAPCQNGATCVDGVNMYTCECVPGFEGVHCETDIDDCAVPNEPCLNGGLCHDYVNFFNCTCPPRTVGYTCATDPCLPSPCMYQGLCSLVNETTDIRNESYSATCACLEGFSGNLCEIGPCEAYPDTFNEGHNRTNGEPYCLNGGVCTNELSGEGFEIHGTASCNCDDTGYYGDRCDEGDGTFGMAAAQTDNNDDSNPSVMDHMKKNPEAVIGAGAGLAGLAGLGMIVALARRRRKQPEKPKDESEAQDEEQPAPAPDKNTTWTGIGSSQPASTQPAVNQTGWDTGMDQFLM